MLLRKIKEIFRKDIEKGSIIIVDGTRLEVNKISITLGFGFNNFILDCKLTEKEGKALKLNPGKYIVLRNGITKVGMEIYDIKMTQRARNTYLVELNDEWPQYSNNNGKKHGRK